MEIGAAAFCDQALLFASSASVFTVMSSSSADPKPKRGRQGMYAW